MSAAVVNKDNFSNQIENIVLESNKSPFGIASNLKKLMERANISEHELSRRTSVKQPIIHRLLSGNNQNPKLLTLKPIADYFMLSVSQLIGEKEIESVWSGLTSKDHQGWVEVQLSNYHQIKSRDGLIIPKSIITENNVSRNAFAFYIVDQSMEPLFPEGCMIIIEPEIKPLHNNYILVKTNNDETLLRNFLSISGENYINPLNSKFGTIVKISSEHEILGTVVRTIYDHRLTTEGKG